MADTKHSNSSSFLSDKNLQEVWKQSRAAGNSQRMSRSEIDNALEEVHKKLGWDDRLGSSEKNSGSPWMVKKYLIAALALIIFGATWIYVPKTVTVPYGERAALELNDGTLIEINSGSTLSYSRLYGWTNRNVSLNGEAYFSVETTVMPFSVEANGTVTEVTGTEFNIRSWRDDPGSETVVAVTQGSVQFYKHDNHENKVSLSAGLYSRLNRKMTTPTEPEPKPAEEIAGWRSNKLIFQEQPITVIFNELERRYDVQIDLDVAGAESEVITAYYTSPQSIDAILEDISTVKGFRYAETANGYRIFK